MSGQFKCFNSCNFWKERLEEFGLKQAGRQDVAAQIIPTTYLHQGIPQGAENQKSVLRKSGQYQSTYTSQNILRDLFLEGSRDLQQPRERLGEEVLPNIIHGKKDYFREILYLVSRVNDDVLKINDLMQRWAQETAFTDRERLLNDISRIIQNSSACKSWPQIGRELGMKQADLDVIAHNYPQNLKEQCHQMLHGWFCSKGSEVTVAALTNALESAGFRNVAEEIQAQIN